MCKIVDAKSIVQEDMMILILWSIMIRALKNMVNGSSDFKRLLHPWLRYGILVTDRYMVLLPCYDIQIFIG